MSEVVAKQSNESNPDNIKNPSLSWIIGFFFVVSFWGPFSVVPLQKDQDDTYDKFLEVVIDFKDQRIDTLGMAEELLKGYRNLILRFNKFVHKGYEIILSKEKVARAKRTAQFEEFINFMNKIKKHFENKNDVYKSFLDILNMYRKKHKGIDEVDREVTELFKGHPDLFDEFIRFLPERRSASSMLSNTCGRMGTTNPMKDEILVLSVQIWARKHYGMKGTHQK